jgi:hypothetical protein
MSISNRNGVITVQDKIRGHLVSKTYRCMTVYQARAAFAAYVRSQCGEVHYA